MKKINPFKFALLGATALTVVSCGDPKEAVLAYDSAEACIKAGLQDAATCEVEFKKAEEEHLRSAPRYSRANDCYSDFGFDRCYRPTGSSVWFPFMMGYMMAPRGGGGRVHIFATALSAVGQPQQLLHERQWAIGKRIRKWSNPGHAGSKQAASRPYTHGFTWRVWRPCREFLGPQL